MKTSNVAKVNAAAKTVSTQIEALAAGQKPFENQLVEQLKAHDLITELQAQSLKQIIGHRNKAAHPSGHLASAEEARYVFRESIDKFLSRPILNTTLAVDEIVNELPATNYFPSRQLTEVAKIVKTAVEPVHASAYRLLVEKIVSSLTSSSTSVNARFFLQGLISADAPTWRPIITTSLIEKRSSDVAFGPSIFMLIAIDAALFSNSNAAAKTRAAKLVTDLVSSTEPSVTLNQTRHPVLLLKNIASNLPPSDLSLFSAFIQTTFAKYWTNAALLNAAAKSPALMTALIEQYIQKAGSSNFDTANAFADLLPEIDSELAQAATNQQAFQIAIGMINAADIGAWRAQRTVAAKFKAAPDIKLKARSFALDPAVAAAGFHGFTTTAEVTDFLATALSDE